MYEMLVPSCERSDVPIIMYFLRLFVVVLQKLPCLENVHTHVTVKPQMFAMSYVSYLNSNNETFLIVIFIFPTIF